MLTLNYIRGYEEEIAIGKDYYFGQLWDGKGDGKEQAADIMDTIVTVTDLY